jgi:hypothetical protein
MGSFLCFGASASSLFRNLREGGTPMAVKKVKAIKKSQKTIKPARGKKDKLPEKGPNRTSRAILINEK